MADAARKLANGKDFIDFQTEPSRYRHWKLTVEGEVATLAMDVDENGGLYAVSYPHLTLPTSDLVWISGVAVSLQKKTSDINGDEGK